MNKLKKIKNLLDKELGEQELIELKKINKKQLEQGKISKKQSELLTKLIESNESLSDSVKTLKDELSDKLTNKDLKQLESLLEKIYNKEQPKKIEVDNLNEIKEVDVKNLKDIKIPKIPERFKIEGKNPDEYPIREEVIERDALGRLLKTRVVYEDFAVIITNQYTKEGYWDGSTYVIE